MGGPWIDRLNVHPSILPRAPNDRKRPPENLKWFPWTWRGVSSLSFVRSCMGRPEFGWPLEVGVAAAARRVMTDEHAPHVHLCARSSTQNIFVGDRPRENDCLLAKADIYTQLHCSEKKPGSLLAYGYGYGWMLCTVQCRPPQLRASCVVRYLG